MDIQQLAQVAANRVNSGGKILQLVMPYSKRTHRYRYLAGRKSPRGRVLGDGNTGEIVNFDALDVFAWCAANGAHVAAYDSNGNEVDFSAASR